MASAVGSSDAVQNRRAGTLNAAMPEACRVVNAACSTSSSPPRRDSPRERSCEDAGGWAARKRGPARCTRRSADPFSPLSDSFRLRHAEPVPGVILHEGFDPIEALGRRLDELDAARLELSYSAAVRVWKKPPLIFPSPEDAARRGESGWIAGCRLSQDDLESAGPSPHGRIGTVVIVASIRSSKRASHVELSGPRPGRH